MRGGAFFLLKKLFFLENYVGLKREIDDVIALIWSDLGIRFESNPQYNVLFLFFSNKKICGW